MENKNRNRALGALITGTLVSGSILSAAQANAAEMFDFNDLGSGSELRTDLLNATGGGFISTEASCGQAKAADGKCGEGKAAEHKCGEGKCGEDAPAEEVAPENTDDVKAGAPAESKEEAKPVSKSKAPKAGKEGTKAPN